MSISEKAALVATVVDEFGLAASLSVVDLARSTWFYQKKRIPYEQRHAEVASLMQRVVVRSPDYGYRRVTPEASETLGRPVNEKVVRRLAQVLGLVQLRKPKAPKKSAIRRTIDEVGSRANIVASLEEIDLFEVLYTDFTELRYGNGKAWLMPILDHLSKDVLGWSLGERADTTLALKAWKMARRRLRSLDIPIQGVIMHHDRDSVYTSEKWVRDLLVKSGVRLSYALRGARDNTQMESWNGRFKTENVGLFLEADTLEELESIVRSRIKYYTGTRRHSTIGNIAPRTFVRRVLEERASQ